MPAENSKKWIPNLQWLQDTLTTDLCQGLAPRPNQNPCQKTTQSLQIPPETKERQAFAIFRPRVQEQIRYTRQFAKVQHLNE